MKVILVVLALFTALLTPAVAKERGNSGRAHEANERELKGHERKRYMQQGRQDYKHGHKKYKRKHRRNHDHDDEHITVRPTLPGGLPLPPAPGELPKLPKLPKPGELPPLPRLP